MYQVEIIWLSADTPSLFKCVPAESGKFHAQDADSCLLILIFRTNFRSDKVAEVSYASEYLDSAGYPGPF
jgi:hypothetical protein